MSHGLYVTFIPYMIIMLHSALFSTVIYNLFLIDIYTVNSSWSYQNIVTVNDLDSVYLVARRLEEKTIELKLSYTARNKSVNMTNICW